MTGPRPDRLTGRERDILTLIAQGLTCRQIARQLNIAYYTVRKHRANMHAKLQLGSGPQLTAFALAQAAGPAQSDCRAQRIGPP